MIINQQVEKAEVFGSVDTSNSMRLNLNAQSYELLLSNLYSDPLGAVLRELTTNAVEANQMSSTDRKVCIQLPSLLSTDLIIKDYGPGLDDQEIDKYLNCLFSSSKGDSNTFMGGFGLGSKSPLALVDSFYLTSVKNGIQYDYLWIKEKGSIPTPIFQGSDKTNSDNGITITVPLGSSTKIPLQNIITYVKEKANRQLFGFKDSVRIVQDISIPYEDMVDISEKIIKWTQELDLPNLTLFNIDKSFSDNTGFRSPRFYGFRNFFIRIGQVVYEYKATDRLNSLINLIPSYINNMGQFVATVNVPVGLLDIPMSREEINNTEDNFKIVEKYFKEGLDQLKNHYSTIVFNTDCGAAEFQKRLNSFTNDSTIQYNIKADSVALKKHDQNLIKTLEVFLKEQNQYYKDGQVVQNIDLYNPLSYYLVMLSNLTLSKTKFYLFNANTNTTEQNLLLSNFTFKLEKDKKYLIVLMPSKATYGTKTSDLSPYIRSLYTSTDPVTNATTLDTFDLVRVIRTDYTAPSFLNLKTFLESLSKDINDVFFNKSKGSLTLLSDFKTEDFKQFVKDNRVVTNGSIVKNEYISGVRFVDVKTNCLAIKKFVDSHPTNSYTYYTSLFKLSDPVHRFEKRIDANSKNIPFGPVYLDTTKYDTVLLTKDETIPIVNKNPYSTTLRAFELEEDLKKACAIKVPEKQYENVKKLFEDGASKFGYKLYTNEKPFDLVLTNIEQLYLKNTTNTEYLKIIAMILKAEIYKNYNYNFWRADLKSIQSSLKKTIEDVLNTYTDKTNVYYLALEKNQSFILDNKSFIVVNHHYNEKELAVFVEYVNTTIINSVSKNKEMFISNIDSILSRSIYSSEITTHLFKKFGWNI